MSLHVCANMHIHIKHMRMHNVAAMPIHMYARVCVCAPAHENLHAYDCAHTCQRQVYCRLHSA